MSEIITLIVVVLLICMLWVMLYDSNRFVVKNLKLKDQKIKLNAKAVLIADLHNKKYGKDNRMLLDAIRKEKPDFILVAGDILVAKPGKSLQTAVDFLGELSKDYPIFYGNGNHEHRLRIYPETYGSMADEYEEKLKNIGIQPLVNQKKFLGKYGICVYGAQIDKEYYKRFRVMNMGENYMDELLGKCDKENYNILLAHNPDYFPRYAQWGADLVCSGHVHGGVVRVPIWGKGILSPGIRLFPKYDGGVFREKNSIMLLSRGLGSHTIPFRLFNPGELLVVEFEHQDKDK